MRMTWDEQPAHRHIFEHGVSLAREYRSQPPHRSGAFRSLRAAGGGGALDEDTQVMEPGNFLAFVAWLAVVFFGLGFFIGWIL